MRNYPLSACQTLGIDGRLTVGLDERLLILAVLKFVSPIAFFKHDYTCIEAVPAIFRIPGDGVGDGRHYLPGRRGRKKPNR